MKISYFNPISKQYHGIQDFGALNKKSQVLVISLSILGSVITLPLLGLGGVATFRWLSDKLNKTNRVASTVLPIQVKDITNREDLDLVENDGMEAPIDILQALEELKDGTFEPPTHKFTIIDKEPHELQDGETLVEYGEIPCGTYPISFSSVKRALKTDKPKPIEDQLKIECQGYDLTNHQVDCIFVVSNDGNKSNAMSLFYSANAGAIFSLALTRLVHNQEAITSNHVLQALKITDEEILTRWTEHVKENPKDLGSLTTVNMLFFYPDEEGNIKGGFLGNGDTRTIILRGEDVIRVGSLKGASLGTFDIKAGDRVFVSSDGIWHNASPNQVGQFIRERMEEHGELERTLVELVQATLLGREDDRNPLLISF